MLNTVRRLFFTILLLCCGSASAELLSFRAEYVAEYQGLPIKAKAVRELTALPDNRFRLISSAKSAFVRVTETSEFEFGEQDLTPLLYTYKRKGLGKNKSEEFRFDWPTGTMHHDGDSSPISSGVLDKLSLQHKLSRDVALMIDSAYGSTELSYRVADDYKRKVYAFKIVDEEILKTPVGDLRTVRVERIREDDDDRQSQFWLAVDHEFLLVKAIQTEDGRGLELSLSNATVNGADILTSTD